MGDVEGAMKYLRAQGISNGKVAVMGFCSGGRQAYLAGGRLKGLDAVVDCWGGGVIEDDPTQLTPERPIAPIDLTKDISAPIIGIFGNEDKRPSPDQVNRHEQILKDLGKTYEFHRYDGVGHGFFAAERPAYKGEQATDGWKKVYAFLDKNIGPRAKAEG
jgi:carboxymethylenebutenolidase